MPVAEPDAHVTHARVEDVALPDHDRPLALVRLAPNHPTRPATLGPRGLGELEAALTAVRERARNGEIAAVAVIGRGRTFLAGADLDVVAATTDREDARRLGAAGHAALGILSSMPVPTFAFVNGAALGGGLELALHCDHRVVSSAVSALGLPETHLGIVPGWGGCWLLPRLLGLAGAIDLAVTRPLAGNRLTGAAEAVGSGLMDAVLEDDGFVDAAVRWAASVLAAGTEAHTDRSGAPDDDAVGTRARRRLEDRLHGAAPAPVRALDLLLAASGRMREEGFAAEDEALADLLLTEQLRAGLYAFDLTTRRARTPLGAPDAALARPVRRVGVVGAGLMAAQLAVLLGRRLGVPVAMREVDDERAAAGRDRVRGLLDDEVRRGRLTPDGADSIAADITVGTDLHDLADADLVIEAVTEVLSVKQRVFAELEDVVASDAVLATNTSALSVEAMTAALRHPERVVGLHFFNPVAQLPLVEVVATPLSSDGALATAFAVASGARKTAVRVADRPGFVVNRVLLRLLADVLACVEDGTPVEVADGALGALGLPMRPFALLDLVGAPVAWHVLRTLHADLGPRYRLSPGLGRIADEGLPLLRRGADGRAELDPGLADVFGANRSGRTAPGPDDVLDRVLHGLTEEIGLLLDDGVVAAAEQVDLALLLGAGWPAYLGGICPYLDRAGWSERVLGRRLVAPGVASLPQGVVARS